MATKIFQYIRKRNPFDSSFNVITYEKHEDSIGKRQEINDESESTKNDSNQSKNWPKFILDIEEKILVYVCTQRFELKLRFLRF